MLQRHFPHVDRAVRALLVLLLCLSGGLALASKAGASNAFYDGISSDGEVVVFTSAEQMVSGDTDQEPDVFVRAYDDVLAEYVTREVSIGPTGGNDTRPARYDGMSTDGTRVFFSTAEPLVPADTDEQEDLYMRDLVHKTTTLVSVGGSSCAAQGCGNGNGAAHFAPQGVSADGEVVFFTTTESLSGEDTDGSLDIYARRIGAEETILASGADPSCGPGPCGNGGEGASYRAIDESGDKVAFVTAESLSGEDGDSAIDVYERDLSAGTTKLVSLAGTCPTAGCVPAFGGISADGSHVFFETGERLSGFDTDNVQDVYSWSSGIASLVSIGPAGGNEDGIALYKACSPDGTAAYFLTDESLVAGDGDEAPDVYRDAEGTTALISAGEGGRGNEEKPASLDWVSLEGTPERAVFSTSEQMVAADGDEGQDVYERAGTATTLISVGEGTGEAANASFAGASSDGSRIFFVTTGQLVPQDTDGSADVYMREGSETVLVSVGQINGNKEFPVTPTGFSGDGSKAFFATQERLTEGDPDGEIDIYERSSSEPPKTLLVSTGNGIAFGPPAPTLEKTVPASPNPSLTPTIVGQSDPATLVKIYKTSNCTGPVVAQGTNQELASPGLTVTVPVAPGTTTNYSATAEAEGILSGCSNSISYRQEEPPPPNEEEAPAGGGSGEESTGGTGGTGGSGGTGSKGGGGTGARHEGLAYVTPLPRITYGPAAKTRLRRPTFRFLDAAEQPGTTFFCRVDRQRWARCTSPIKVRKLKLGKHVFSLKAVNAVGTPGASAVKRKFKVVGR